MLSSISWQHYLAAVVIITISYYLYVILRYYQKEIGNLFNRKPQNADVFSAIQSPVISVMGQAKPDNGVTVTETQNLPFTDVMPDEPIQSITEQMQTADIQSDPSSELVSEAGNLIDAFKDVDNKQEFLTLLGILVSSYKRFQEQIDLPAALSRVVEISKDKLKFTVALSDFQNTWA
ncbi:hypothetical protein [Mucilaginibacter gossypii]|uniref:Uncharacterized protein n=1 Tax=Mucilaginibacter gossypii TaxID=551996 RepID=A0A1G7RJ55_9SPHI|nr:hypothetical protein [Mucilaginibacter gossypii]SDG10761.1 hypothetical protein SAMN05192573_102258 [Mucilaginibacter gossypii]